MAKRSVTNARDFSKRGVRKTEWKGLLNGDFGETVDLSDFQDKTFHIFGTTGTGGSITLFGSNSDADVDLIPSDGASTWITLQDASAADITVTTASAGGTILQNYKHTSMEVTAGDGDTDFTVILESARTK